MSTKETIKVEMEGKGVKAFREGLRRVLRFAAKKSHKRPELEQVRFFTRDGMLFAQAGNGSQWVEVCLVTEVDAGPSSTDVKGKTTKPAPKKIDGDIAFTMGVATVKDWAKWFSQSRSHVELSFTTNRITCSQFGDSVSFPCAADTLRETMGALFGIKRGKVTAKTIRIEADVLKFVTTSTLPSAGTAMRLLAYEDGVLGFEHGVVELGSFERGFIMGVEIVADGEKPKRKTVAKKPVKAKAKPVKKATPKPVAKPVSKPKAKAVAKPVEDKPKPVETVDAKPANVYPMGTRAFTNALLKMTAAFNADNVLIEVNKTVDAASSQVKATVSKNSMEVAQLTAVANGSESYTGTVKVADIKKAHRLARKLAKSGEREKYSPYLTVGKGVVGLLKLEATKAPAIPEPWLDGEPVNGRSIPVVEELAALLRGESSYMANGKRLEGEAFGKGARCVVHTVTA